MILPTGRLNASKYSNGSLIVENTSTDGQQIESVRLNLSTALLPDMVF